MDFKATTERRLNDHADRIRMLEISDATKNEKIDTLCRKMDELANRLCDFMDFIQAALWKVLAAGGTLLLIFLGFFIWYVQGLGG